MLPDEVGFRDDPGRLINEGILLDVRIGRRPTRSEPNPPLVEQQALIDTGAQDCYVDDDLARELRLDLRGSDPVGRIRDVRGPQKVLIYSTFILIDRFDIALHDPCPSYKIREMGGDFGVILGRHFLRQMRMLYDGPSGSVTMQRISRN